MHVPKVCTFIACDNNIQHLKFPFFLPYHACNTNEEVDKQIYIISMRNKPNFSDPPQLPFQDNSQQTP